MGLAKLTPYCLGSLLQRPLPIVNNLLTNKVYLFFHFHNAVYMFLN